MQLCRDEALSKDDWLFYLYNNCGYTDLCLGSNYLDINGELKFGKWKRYDEIMGYDLEFKRKVLQRFTHRSILDIEVMFDVDDLSMPIGNSKFKFATIELKSRFIYQKLKTLKLNPVAYFTGNKSYHINIILPELRNMTRYARSNFKEKLLNKFGGDLMKKSERCLIAIEGVKHYRSGKKKSQVFW